jgi:hypothetical protein
LGPGRKMIPVESKRKELSRIGEATVSCQSPQA